MNKRHAPPSQKELEQALGLRRLMEHLFPGRGRAATVNFLRARGAIKDHENTSEGNIMTMPPFWFGLILAPIDHHKVNKEHRAIVDNVMTLINASSERRLDFGSVAQKLRVKMESIHEAIIAAGSEADRDFMLVIMADQTTGKPWVEITPRPYDIHERILVQERKEVGAKCAALIKNDDVVFIDGGVHTFEAYLAICDRIASGALRNIKVVTNSVRISVHKRDNWLSANLTVVQTGGIVRPDRKTCCGPASVRDFSEHAALADKDNRRAVGLVGATYITKHGCAVNTDLEFAGKLELMKLKYAVILGDRQKWVDHEHGYVFAPFHSWPRDRFIASDKEPSETWLRRANARFDVPTNSAAIWQPRRGPIVVKSDRSSAQS